MHTYEALCGKRLRGRGRVGRWEEISWDAPGKEKFLSSQNSAGGYFFSINSLFHWARGKKKANT